MSEFLNLKKVELHCHLDGSLTFSGLEQLAREAGITIPHGEELAKRVQAAKDNDSLAEYLKCFDIPISLLRVKGSIKKAVCNVLEEVAKENVIYIELRFAPIPLENEAYSIREMIEEAIAGLQEGYAQFGVRGNIILCGMRHMSAEENIKILKVAREYLGNGVCAVDMAGSEAMFPIMLQRKFFEEAARLEIPFTIHAGECGSAASVRDAIALGASRLGHGIAIWNDRELLKECKRRHIPLEMCPISNMQTKASPSAKEYPFPLFYKEELPITINTDNRMVSNTNLLTEFQFLQEHYHVTPEDAIKLTCNAVDAAFTTDAVKQELWKQVMHGKNNH